MTEYPHQRLDNAFAWVVRHWRLTLVLIFLLPFLAGCVSGCGVLAIFS